MYTCTYMYVPVCMCVHVSIICSVIVYASVIHVLSVMHGSLSKKCSGREGDKNVDYFGGRRKSVHMHF